MPAAPVRTLFGVADCKLDIKMLGQLAQLCTPDRPANTTSLIGDFAFSEICVSEGEAAKLMDIVVALRSAEHAEHIANVVAGLKQQAAEKKNAALRQYADSIAAEYARLCKVFFLRSRCIEVSRASTNEIIGRIVSFPDQMSDDYGNNLEPRGEKGMNPVKVFRGEKAGQVKGNTLYLGHGQGATMAQICGCLDDAQCIVFDSTIVSELLVQSLFRNELPKTVHMEERGEEREWNVVAESLELVVNSHAPVVPAAIAVAQKAAEEQAARQAEEAERKKEEDKAQGKPQPPAKKEGEEEKPTPAEQAAAYFEKRESNTIYGLVPEGAVTRFMQTGKFPASALSNLMSTYMTSVSASAYPYAAPAKKENN